MLLRPSISTILFFDAVATQPSLSSSHQEVVEAPLNPVLLEKEPTCHSKTLERMVMFQSCQDYRFTNSPRNLAIREQCRIQDLSLQEPSMSYFWTNRTNRTRKGEWYLLNMKLDELKGKWQYDVLSHSMKTATQIVEENIWLSINGYFACIWADQQFWFTGSTILI